MGKGPLTKAAGLRIEAWREASKMSQKLLAQHAGVKATNTLNSFLKGRNGTSIENIAALAAVFGRTLVDVFASKEPPPTKYAQIITLYNAMPSDSNRATVRRIMREYAGLPPDQEEEPPSAPHLRLAGRSPAEKK